MKRPIILIVILVGVLLLAFAVLNAEESGTSSGIVDAASDMVYDKVFNRQPGTMPILPSFKITSYKELYQHPAIPAEVPEKYHKYLGDNNLYTNEIHISPYDVCVYKTLRFGKGQHILYTSVINDSYYPFVGSMKKAREASGKEYEPEEVWDMPADTKMYIYDLTELRNKKSPLMGSESRIKFMSLRDSDDRVIWEYAYEDIYRKQGLNHIYDNKRILDVKKLDSGIYMLLMKYDEWANVLYVDTTMEPRVTEAYTVHDMVTVSMNLDVYKYPSEGEILNDNTVWVRYENGKSKRFKVRYSTEHVIANLIKSGGENVFDR
ncbi:MAG: hypothetical protein IK083_04805 [Abditibacteriota bacterium]|nr:hypothetical protein [Abditibacteriota bacterium]